MPKTIKYKDARMDFKINSTIKKLAQARAKELGLTLTDFVTNAVQKNLK